MSEDGSRPKSAQGSDAERDLLSRENLIRPLTSKERARLETINRTTLRQLVIVPLEKDAQEDSLKEDDEDAADDDWNEADL